jgi:hypothetical protein
MKYRSIMNAIYTQKSANKLKVFLVSRLLYFLPL